MTGDPAEISWILKALESGSMSLVVILLYLALRHYITKLDTLTAALRDMTVALTAGLSDTNSSLTLLKYQAELREQANHRAAELHRDLELVVAELKLVLRDLRKKKVDHDD